MYNNYRDVQRYAERLDRVDFWHLSFLLSLSRRDNLLIWDIHYKGAVCWGRSDKLKSKKRDFSLCFIYEVYTGLWLDSIQWSLRLYLNHVFRWYIITLMQTLFCRSYLLQIKEVSVYKVRKSNDTGSRAQEMGKCRHFLEKRQGKKRSSYTPIGY